MAPLESKARVVGVTKIGCRGFCEKGPNVTITPGDILYTQVKPEDVDEIVERHLIRGEIVERLVYVDPISRKASPAPARAHARPA